VIRSNLSTRPFYNERAVRLWMMLLAVVVAAVTVFNVARVLRYSQSDTELATQAARDESRAAELRREAGQLRGSVDLQQIALASTEARVANQLIDRRTFSWTDLFNQFEATFPDDVRITSVRPELAEGGVQLTLTIVARSVDDVDELMRNLESTGMFSNFLSVQERFNDDGLLVATLEGAYMPPAGQTGVPKVEGTKPQ
jgi:type IV pilus assembly protein PilN